MAGKRFDWNVVVVGAWNAAILTPEGIAHRLFGLPPGTPVEVQVPLDRQAPIRVVHSNVMVVPSESGLLVVPTEPTPEALRHAVEVASRAIDSLPETPFTAAGINLRYQFDILPDELVQPLTSSLDDQLGDAELKIEGRMLKRTVGWNQGVLNVEIHMNDDASGALMFNFHRQSSDILELKDWLGQVEAMIDRSEHLLSSTFKVRIEENEDE